MEPHLVEKVTHVRTNRNIDLSKYDSLRVLQAISTKFGSLLGAVDQLEERVDLCPNLKIIEFQQLIEEGVRIDTDPEELATVRERLAARNSVAGSDIRLILDQIWRYPIPGLEARIAYWANMESDEKDEVYWVKKAPPQQSHTKDFGTYPSICGAMGEVGACPCLAVAG